jgi:hypothetical protein
LGATDSLFKTGILFRRHGPNLMIGMLFEHHGVARFVAADRVIW